MDRLPLQWSAGLPVIPSCAEPRAFHIAEGDNFTYVLLDNVTDIDNDSLTFYLDNSSTRGTLILHDNATGNFTYIADGGIGTDNFSYHVIDNYSVGSHPGFVEFHVFGSGGGVIAPEPAYNVDNFTANVDNSSTITTRWDHLSGQSGQAPHGFLVLCSENDNLTVPTDNISYTEDNQCADGSGAVNLDNSSTQFTWFGLDDNQTYYFSIHSFTNSGLNINYFAGGNLQSDNGTTPVASGGGGTPQVFTASSMCTRPVTSSTLSPQFRYRVTSLIQIPLLFKFMHQIAIQEKLN